MDYQEIEQKTYELLNELRNGAPIGFFFTPDLAYIILCQLNIALEHPLNEGLGVPSDLTDFIEQLRTEIFKRCSPSSIEFIKKIN